MATPDHLPAEVRTAFAVGAGLATRRSLRRIGATHADLDAWCREGLVERVTRGVYGEPLVDATREARYRRFVCGVLLAKDGHGVVVTGPAALVLHGLPLLGTPPALVHALGSHAHGHRAADRVRVVGPGAPDEYEKRGSWCVATPARAVLDCARVFGVAAAVAAADVALREGVATEVQLASFCERLSGTKGVERARRSVRLASRLSESPGESWSAVVIDDLGLPAPGRQHEMWDRDGLVGRSDFWWGTPRVVGEFDGRVKYGRQNPAGRAPEDVLWAEKRREDRIRASGVTVVRWTTAELARPARLASLLGRALGGA